MKLIQTLQKHCATDDYKSEVQLVRDDDGLFKVLKEKVSYSSCHGYIDEHVALSYLSGYNFVPRFYGITSVGGKEYIRKSYVYGQSLYDCYKDNVWLSLDTIKFLLSDIAKKLKILEDNNILYLDLKPDNIIFSDQIYFFDLGLCRFKNKDETFQAVMSHPKYSAPEIGSGLNSKSIIFQFGLIAHELLYGYHPANNAADLKNMDWSYGLYFYFDTMLKSSELDVKEPFIKKMLSYDLNKRPTIEECVEYFNSPVSTTSFKRKFRPNFYTVLFPARMGIPHYGHILFLSRLIDLGYKVLISIQRSYTLTDTDPIPKWLVSKIVAQSLFDMGYSEECFDICLTPFYKDDSSTKLHFSTLPYKFNEVASSNLSVARLFPSHQIIQQKDVFGYELEEYTDLSWGKILRDAIKNNDYETFKRYAASGVEKILSFEELKSLYPKEDNLFVYTNGKVIVELLDGDSVLLRKNVYRYSTPEQCLDNAVIDRYTMYPTICLEGKKTVIYYYDSVYDEDKLVIRYKIKSTF
jgi:serine/threonine protein kinase